MNNLSIIRILREGGLILNHEFDNSALRFVEINNRSYNRGEFLEFKTDLIEAGSKVRVLFLQQQLPPDSVSDFVKGNGALLLAFKDSGEALTPV